MKKYVSRRSVYIMVAAVIIAIVAAVSITISTGHANVLETMAQPIIKPLKSLVTSMVESLEQMYDYMYKYDTLKAENEALKAEIARLEEEYREYADTSAENERLHALFGFSERHQDFVYAPVSVISWSASNYASSFTISKGTDDGIALYDSVITETGYLVGQVTSVTATSGTVTTIIDTRMSVGAMVYETGETGVAQGDFELMNNEQMKMIYVSEAQAISIGDTIVTSGSGGTYPKGLVIGTISGVGSNGSGLEEYAIIDSAADINASTHLFVVTDFSVSD